MHNPNGESLLIFLTLGCQTCTNVKAESNIHLILDRSELHMQGFCWKIKHAANLPDSNVTSFNYILRYRFHHEIFQTTIDTRQRAVTTLAVTLFFPVAPHCHKAYRGSIANRLLSVPFLSSQRNWLSRGVYTGLQRRHWGRRMYFCLWGHVEWHMRGSTIKWIVHPVIC